MKVKKLTNNQASVIYNKSENDFEFVGIIFQFVVKLRLVYYVNMPCIGSAKASRILTTPFNKYH